MKEHLGNLKKTHDDVVHFLDANNLGHPQSSLEWRQCYRELGKFMAMKAFLTNTPRWSWRSQLLTFRMPGST